MGDRTEAALPVTAPVDRFRVQLAEEAGGHRLAIAVDQRVVLCTCGWRDESDDNLTRPVRNWALHVSDALLPLIAAERDAALAPVRALVEENHAATRRMSSALIAMEPRLRDPYPDDPRWTPWTRFVRPRLLEIRDIADRLRIAAAAPSPATPTTNEGNER